MVWSGFVALLSRGGGGIADIYFVVVETLLRAEFVRIYIGRDK